MIHIDANIGNMPGRRDTELFRHMLVDALNKQSSDVVAAFWGLPPKPQDVNLSVASLRELIKETLLELIREKKVTTAELTYILTQ